MGRSSDIIEFTKHRDINLHKEDRNQLYKARYLKHSQSSIGRAINQYFNDEHFENKHLNSG